MNAPIFDLQQRQLALDPFKSFIVQAPAGSGKTSLLVQRYLVLLAKVNAPEEIVAITFTRKAAYEIRDRIINALKKSTLSTPNQDQYAATTQKLALAALQQNKTKAWNIIQNPNRLRIQTIDSFCNYLVRQMPILAKFSVAAKIIQGQEAEIYYRDIARTVLENLTDPQYANYLETLLLHLDNDWQRAENLFITMLKSREQWLPHIVGLKNSKKLRQNMEAALQTVAQENLERCQTSFPKDLQKELCFLLNFSKDNQENPPPFLQAITSATNFCNMELQHWHGIANFLLTKGFSWRKKITKEQGFPAPSSGRNKAEKELFKTVKERMETLLLKFNKQENFRLNLENLLTSPPPNYNDQQWEIIAALLKLLPLLAAQLKVTFNKHGVTDYSEISMAASQALGNNDLPSDLALNLDYHLQHLLVDEFQDTSVAQYRLIEQLITAWQQDDGRTLFVVGDPMQSIYRFREAEVGLFLRAQNEGIGMLKLHPLTLTTNFRSYQNIVTWINSNFAKIFPSIADISLGAVPFSPSAANKKEKDSQINVELLKNTDSINEARHVVTTIQKLQQQDPGTSIAILAKARSHLQEIVTTMRKANLDYQAHDLETLGESVVVRDLFALTRALFHLADRIAWLAILRAPWCGLNLKDLHTLANASSKLIWDNICSYHTLNLSTEGENIVAKFKQKIAPILAKRGRILWCDLVETAWFTLGGPATVNDKIELEYATVYLKLLNTNFLDIEIIQKKINELYAPSTQTAKIQVMTVHKAKGLEFDHVIIPGINRTTRSAKRKLMLWFERPQMHGGSSLLLAPIEAKGNTIDSVYNYLQLVEQKKNFYETGRLLYVALTRAKKTVYIIGNIKPTNKKTDEIPKDSLLKQLEPCFNANWIVDKIEKPNTVNTKIKPGADLYRLSKEWLTPVPITTAPTTVIPKWQLPNNQAAILGIVIHYCLRQISEAGSEIWSDKKLAAQKPYWCKTIQQLGYINIDYGLKLINQAIKLTLEDKRGQWILAKHKFAENELAITTKINDKLEHVILDRTFVDKDEIRWIIDYKTSQPYKKNIDEFLSQEKIKYTQQLLNYAKIMQELDHIRPIKLGLYFPLFSGWVEIN